MADQAARNIQYEYKANSNLVLQVNNQNNFSVVQSLIKVWQKINYTMAAIMVAV